MLKISRNTWWKRALVAGATSMRWSSPASALIAFHPPGTRSRTSTGSSPSFTARRSLRLLSTEKNSEESTDVPEESKMTCTDGTVLALQIWKSPTTTTTTTPTTTTTTTTAKNIFLLTHGWMDNCRSFHHLAPALAKRIPNASVYAIDLPGHGHSSHKSIDAPPIIQADLAYYLSEAVQYIRNEEQIAENNNHLTATFTLVGHSLGAGISSLYASAFPEMVDRLILLDGAGFLPRQAEDTSSHVRNHILHRQKWNTKNHPDKKLPRVFPSIELAITTRRRNAKKMPGEQSLSHKAAAELVQRATLLVGDGIQVQFQHDPRFGWPSLQYMTWPQVEGIFQAIGKHQHQQVGTNLQVCILLAEEGWPFPETQLKRTLELLQPTYYKTLPGSHYFHADPETADAVATAIVEFCDEAW